MNVTRATVCNGLTYVIVLAIMLVIFPTVLVTVPAVNAVVLQWVVGPFVGPNAWIFRATSRLLFFGGIFGSILLLRLVVKAGVERLVPPMVSKPQ